MVGQQGVDGHLREHGEIFLVAASKSLISRTDAWIAALAARSAAARRASRARPAYPQSPSPRARHLPIDSML